MGWESRPGLKGGVGRYVRRLSKLFQFSAATLSAIVRGWAGLPQYACRGEALFLMSRKAADCRGLGTSGTSATTPPDSTGSITQRPLRQCTVCSEPPDGRAGPGARGPFSSNVWALRTPRGLLVTSTRGDPPGSLCLRRRWMRLRGRTRVLRAFGYAYTTLPAAKLEPTISSYTLRSNAAKSNSMNNGSVICMTCSTR